MSSQEDSLSLYWFSPFVPNTTHNVTIKKKNFKAQQDYCWGEEIQSCEQRHSYIKGKGEAVTSWQGSEQSCWMDQSLNLQ